MVVVKLSECHGEFDKVKYSEASLKELFNFFVVNLRKSMKNLTILTTN